MARGNKFKKQNNKKNSNKFSKSKNKKPRKTYSLSKQRNVTDDYKPHLDRNKEIKPLPPPPPEVSSESEDDNDHMTQLRDTFGNNFTKSVDDSEADDSDSEMDEANDDAIIETTNEEEADSGESDMDDNEEDEKSEDEIEIENDEDNDISTEDPFHNHFLHDINESLLQSVQNNPMITNNSEENWPKLGNLSIQIPQCKEEKVCISEFSIAEQKTFAPPGSIPQRIHSNVSLDDLFIKTQIVNNISKANKSFNNSTKSQKLPLTTHQCEIFSVLNNYQDILYPHRTFENSEEIRFTYALHAINHVLKTRTKVIHHNARLSKREDVPEEFRDQGLVRPKVLIIVPFRDAAYKIINMIIDILIEENKGNVVNKHRFVEEFTGSELIMPKKNPKPEDYETLFQGNSNDDFKIGITVTKKSLKLYADFYSSDIIIASPLGLRYIIGAEGESERDFDFLASIEVLILDQTDIFLMQNWDHLLHIVNHLHLQPKESHGTDFSRVRTWSLNGWSKYYRQTIIFSSIVLPEINFIFNKKCFNYAGKIKVVNAVKFGTIRQVYLQLPHVYHKFEAKNVMDGIDARFNFFVSKILPQQKDVSMKQTLIYVANYFDYVRLRNYFKKEDIGFVQICEYSKDAKIARARDMFFHGDAHFLLYSERYHFFNRKTIKGIRHLVFYQPPNIPNFYYEMCNLMQEANMNKKIGNTSNMTVTVLYSNYDIHQLSGIIGTERTMKLLSSDRNVHMLLTD